VTGTTERAQSTKPLHLSNNKGVRTRPQTLAGGLRKLLARGSRTRVEIGLRRPGPRGCGGLAAAVRPSDLWPPRDHGADSSDWRFARPTSSGPFLFRLALPIFAACTIQRSLIKRSRAQSAAGRRSSGSGHFVLNGAPMSTSAAGFLVAMRWRPTKAKSLTRSGPRMIDAPVTRISPVRRRPGG